MNRVKAFFKRKQKQGPSGIAIQSGDSEFNDKGSNISEDDVETKLLAKNKDLERRIEELTARLAESSQQNADMDAQSSSFVYVTPPETVTRRKKTQKKPQFDDDIIEFDIQSTEEHEKLKDLETKDVDLSVPPETLGTAELTESTNPFDESMNTTVVDIEMKSSSDSSLEDATSLINRLRLMEENNLSTNEELQATVQELTDIRGQMVCYEAEKEKYRKENMALLDTVCRATERLQTLKDEYAALEVKLMAKTNKEGGGSHVTEKCVLKLIKSGESERNTLLKAQSDLKTECCGLNRALNSAEQEVSRLYLRVRTLEQAADESLAKQKKLEDNVAAFKEEIAVYQFKIIQLETLLESEQNKVSKLKASHESLGNETELLYLIETSLKEKDNLQKDLIKCEQDLARKTNENIKLNEQMAAFKLELQTLKNDIVAAGTELTNNRKSRDLEKKQNDDQIFELKNKVRELSEQVEMYENEKKMNIEKMKVAQMNLKDVLKKLTNAEKSLTEEQQKRVTERKEWSELQEDMLVAVKVANEMKSEGEKALKNALQRVKELEDHNCRLQSELNTNKENRILTPPTVKSTIVIPAISQPAPKETPKSALKDCSQTEASQPKEVAFAPQDVPQRKPGRPSIQCVSVKSLIQSIENASKTAKTDPVGSHGSLSEKIPPKEKASVPLRDQQLTSNKQTPAVIESPKSDVVKDSVLHGIFDRSYGSKRNALLKWCQNKTQDYPGVEITNFSTSWCDGMAFCALLHTYIPDKIPYSNLSPNNNSHNLQVAFNAAQSMGIPTILAIEDLTQVERPNWHKVIAYVVEIYKRFEG